MASMPEIKLEPIDFGTNDEDRVKDMFEKVFLAEYEIVRTVDCLESVQAICNAMIGAKTAARCYQSWLKGQEPKP